MVSVAVLGIALTGLVQMHTTSIRGTAKAEDIGRATEIARQIAALEANVPDVNLPACGGIASPVPAGGLLGCRGSDGPSAAFSNPRGDCTRWVEEDAVVDPVSGAIAVIDERPGAYRVDTWVTSHPNGGDNNGIVHVWVCWRDAGGLVNEVYTARLRVGDVWPE